MFDKHELIAGDLLVINWSDSNPDLGIFVAVSNSDEDDLVTSVDVLTLRGMTTVEADQVKRHSSCSNIFAKDV
jgi:hypothetical protein